LYQSKVNRPVVSLSAVAKNMAEKEGKIAVLVGKIVDDERIVSFPKMTVCALKFSKTARARVVKNGGEAITFDQLALRSPKGANTVLLRGKKNTRAAVKHFGVPGARGSTVKPYGGRVGRKSEGRR
jgi:large subunit ribosomal protein L18e